MRPAFAKDFPQTPEIDALVDDFARGNFAAVRAAAARLPADSREDDPAQKAIRALARRIEPDPMSVALIAIAAALVLVLGIFWMAFGKPPGGPLAP